MVHNGWDKLSDIESFAQAYVEYIGLPFPIFLSYVAGFSIPYLELSALYAACFLFFVINGAGSFSVDAWLAQGLKSQLSSEQAKQLTALEKSYTQEGDSDATEVGTGIQ